MKVDSQLVKRLKSLAWRAGVMGLIAAINVVVDGVAGVGLPGWSIIVIGLLGGEVTKFLNTKVK